MSHHKDCNNPIMNEQYFVVHLILLIVRDWFYFPSMYMMYMYIYILCTLYMYMYICRDCFISHYIPSWTFLDPSCHPGGFCWMIGGRQGIPKYPEEQNELILGCPVRWKLGLIPKNPNHHIMSLRWNNWFGDGYIYWVDLDFVDFSRDNWVYT